MWTFVGVWVLVTSGANVDDIAVRRGLWRAALVGVGMLAYVLIKAWAWPYYAQVADRPHYPGRPLAAEVNRRWTARFDSPLPIVAGDAWVAGNVCCFSPHRPVLYSNGSMGYLVFDSKGAPWVTDGDLTTRGGVIVWDADQLGDELPAVVRVRFPGAIGEPPVSFPYQTGAPIPRARVGLAFVPPARD